MNRTNCLSSNKDAGKSLSVPRRRKKKASLRHGCMAVQCDASQNGVTARRATDVGAGDWC